MEAHALTLDHLALAAARRRRQLVQAKLRRSSIEVDPRSWLTAMFPRYVTRPFSAYHHEFWDWIWSIERGTRSRPFVGIWPRGAGKSTSTELACASVAARQARRYALYVCETQEQADDHVANVAGLLEGTEFAAMYPEAASRRMGKYGNVKGWRRNRLRTASGFTLDAIGLDTAARGIKMDEDRPDFLIFDDIDGELDTPATTEKKIKVITRKLIPAGSDTPVVLAVQNLVIPDGVFSRLADGRADFLANRIVSGPHPAILGLTYEQVDGKATITGGTPTWEGMDLTVCQAEIDDMGITAFLTEKQQEVEAPPGGMFNHVVFRHCTPEAIAPLVRTVVWIDPAVTDTDMSDSHGIQADGLGVDGKIYRLYSWEQRTSPQDVMRRGIVKAIDLGADTVGIETDQGGDTWQSVYDEALRYLVANGAIPVGKPIPRFKAEKAGGRGPKAHRAGPMLAAYERAEIIHVVPSDPSLQTHHILEKALRRFPRTKPYDLVDASVWSWLDLTGGVTNELRPPSGMLADYLDGVM